MSPSKPITVIGGGLAGLTLGIGLRQQGVAVTIREAGHYPRHRVCGEFISGGGQRVLTRLGLEAALFQAGALRASSAAFHLGPSRSPVRPLAQPGWCLSRFTLDALLAEQFRQLGGELLEHDRCPADGLKEGVVRASGRRVESPSSQCRWFGLKAHARGLPLEADLEMHGFRDGYVGLCRLPQGEFNVCGLFRHRVGKPHPATSWQASLRGPPGSALRARLEPAVFDEGSFCSVGGLSLRPQRARDRSECCIGDAITMIPPVTGNGMSMAFESAELAVKPLAAWSRGELSWPQARELVAAACDRAFARRLTWARWLQAMMFTPALRGPLGVLVLRSEGLWRLLFARTR
jgi:menaquinone-9 beta-reductase